MADLGLLGKFVITRLYGHLWRRSLQQNVPLWLHFKGMLVRRWWHLRQGVFEARIVGLLFWAFSLGPPLAKSQKMADLGLLGKFVITRLYGHLWRRSLQQNGPLWLHSKWILIRRWWHLRQGAFEAHIDGLLFWAFSLGPRLAKSQKMADLGLLGKFVITRLYGHLWRCSLQQNVPLGLHFKCILSKRWCDLREGAFEAHIIGLILSIFPWSPPCKISENGRVRSPWQICYNSALRALMEAQFAAKCSSMIALQVHTNLEMMQFSPGCFWSPYSRPTFLSIFPWSPHGKISENGRFRSPWQICHNSALRALMEAQFAAKCSSMIAL